MSRNIILCCYFTQNVEGLASTNMQLICTEYAVFPFRYYQLITHEFELVNIHMAFVPGV